MKGEQNGTQIIRGETVYGEEAKPRQQASSNTKTLQKECQITDKKEYICVIHEQQYIQINPLKTKRRLLYLKTQFVPRSKHILSRL